MGVPRPFLALRLHTVFRHPAGALIVKHLEGEAWHHPLDTQPSSTRQVQSGGVDKHWVLAAVVQPHSILFPTQHDAVADFTANLLYAAAAVIPSTTIAVMSVETRCAVAARVIPAAVVGVGVELAEAEARALR